MRLLGAARLISRIGLWFGGGLILLAAVVIGIDVLLRKFLASSIGGADELAGYALAIGSAWAMSATLLDRGHIRIDSLYVRFGLSLRSALDLLGLALFLAFFGLVAWHGSGVVAQSWIAGSRSQSALETPIVVPQAVWVAGLVFFLLAGVLLFVQAAMRLVRGHRAEAVRLIGTRTAEEEVEDELRVLRARSEAHR